MAIYQDLIEEVARIHGYDNIQISLPKIDVKLENIKIVLKAQLRQTMAHWVIKKRLVLALLT
jgi:phenylalanyl-tRNA synthetase beta chain